MRFTNASQSTFTANGLIVRELVEDIELPALQAKTEAALHPAPDLKALRAPLL